MLTCPVCDSPNADGSVICENCNSAFESESHRTGPTGDLTVAAEPGFSGMAAAPARAFASELVPGTVIAGRYEIVLRLGQGGMGTVYKALDLELDRVIALKTIRPDLAANASALRRLKQETLLARQITHRNVIRVFDLGVSEGLRFITMEYVAGQDLKAYIEDRKKLPVEEAVGIIKQICHGLQAAHAEDVIHRDLKPQNILMASNGRVRLMDFGLARSFEDTGLSRSGAILGTPAYMSPEQAMGQPGDARSDIFSLGIICFELLTGELPFQGRTLAEMFLSRTRDRARPIESVDPSLPAGVARVVMRCLDSKPANRYSSVQEILDHLADPAQALSAAKPPAAGTLAAGSMLGSRYRIEGEAGEGGLGRVYKATDLDLNRTVALKVVRPELASDPKAFEQLKHEISVASQVSHRNVLRIHDIGELNGVRYVSMAWADGEDLGHLLRRCGPLPEARVVRLGIELCEGLRAAHELDITHRDLKPSNILLDSTSHPCIADFGLAQTSLLESGSQSSTTSGTPRYMSPEQVEGARVDGRSDIYSLGLILYEMAAGKIPFRDESVLQTMAQRITETPASPKLINPAISDGLAAIVLRCLERDPEKRYGSVTGLLDDLRRQESGLLAPAIEVPVRRKARVGRTVVYSALVLVAALIALAVYLSRRTPPPPVITGRYVAVLPFRALSSDSNAKYQAEGIADAVSGRLASLDSIHAVSSSAIERAKLDQGESDIARQLGANILVHGSLQKIGDKIAVSTHIYSLDNHADIAYNRYQRDATDLFALEDEISNDVMKALSVKPSIQERERLTARQPTENAAAYDLYLQGRDILKNQRDAQHAAAALNLFERASKQDPDFALALTGVADSSLLLYRTRNEPTYASKALQAAEQARDRDETLPEVHFALGSVFSATGRNGEAVKELKRALELQPNSDDGYVRLGRAYLATGQKDAALNSFRQAVKINPYYWYNHKQLGYGYMQLGQMDEALREFQEQVRLNPKDPSGFNNIGAIYYRRAEWQKCIPEFETAIKLSPNSDSYSNLGTAYFELGRYADAILMYEKAAGLSPNKPEVIRNLGDAYSRAGNKQKADSAYNHAIALLYGQLQVNSQDATTLGSLARCYGAKGDYATARDLVRRARAINPSSSDLMYLEAVVNANTGRVSDALQSLKNAFENGYDFEYCLTDPDLENVRKSPGFEALRRQFSHPASSKER